MVVLYIGYNHIVDSLEAKIVKSLVPSQVSDREETTFNKKRISKALFFPPQIVVLSFLYTDVSKCLAILRFSLKE